MSTNPLLAELIRERYSHPEWWVLTQPDPPKSVHDRVIHHALDRGLERLAHSDQEVA